MAAIDALPDLHLPFFFSNSMNCINGNCENTPSPQMLAVNANAPKAYSPDFPSDLENMVASCRKRRRGMEEMECPPLPYGSSSFSAPIHSFLSGSKLYYADDGRCDDLSMNVSTSGRGYVSKEELQSHLLQQRQDIDHLILILKEQTRQALEVKRQRHTRTLLGLIEKGVHNILSEKDAEIQRLLQRNAELESKAQQLITESEAWQNMARGHDIMVSNLRATLDQMVAQKKEPSKAEGYGESEVDDAESCYYSKSKDVSENNNNSNSTVAKYKSACKICQTKEVCILLLPCRHLCLCKDCESRVDFCPLCKSVKNASVQVYMS